MQSDKVADKASREIALKTDEKKLKTLAVTLRWENRYRNEEHLTGEGAFCPELDTLDPDFSESLGLYGLESGKLLEIGAGVGMQAIGYAQLGFEVTATDVSATAINTARSNAAKQEIPAASLAFVTDNILSTTLRDTFDVVADRGCFATLKSWELEDYCRNVRRLLKDNGLFLLKANAGQYGMVKPLESLFRVEKSWDTFYHGQQTQGPPALFFILRPRLLLEQQFGGTGP
ncbi:class I SAM-dependent methyltransferase [Methylomonas fluvii]|uniref:Class I SAM-dependent methyltransferase n=1 Tax=Methylomonas fluvii TaxID=1854564 RepID=A0ABR9DH83_9GAMM|nr:class I SAM-dependent methyltransferase [Methylomonas fluvii]MBD9362464.1 class I SAM-dependent methyltransferase [Methylomonas fluvii]